jgi:hypothetical protein
VIDERKPLHCIDQETGLQSLADRHGGENLMGARTSSTVKRVRGDLSRDRSPAESDAAPPKMDAAPCLSIVHFDDDQDDRALLIDEAIDNRENRGLPVHDPMQLAAIIEQRIAARTLGRIRNLNVSCEGGRVVIRGQCATFYTKQLAQHAAMGVIEDEIVLNEISVGFCR